MRKFCKAATGGSIAAVAALALTGCASEPRRRAAAPRRSRQGLRRRTPLIGVALPTKTSENWVLAGDLFTNGLKEAGFKADVQYAGASTLSPTSRPRSPP